MMNCGTRPEHLPVVEDLLQAMATCGNPTFDKSGEERSMAETPTAVVVAERARKLCQQHLS